MPSDVFELSLAGHVLRYSFVFPQTRYMLRPIPSKADGGRFDISVSQERLSIGRSFLPPDSSDAYVEFRCLIELTARRLLRSGACLFHAVSFVWRDRAWLLAAPSGVGKTTQFLNWQRLFPGEITMISGDMPVIDAHDDGSIWVHPSPWNGKEKLHSSQFAKLSGLVLLQQGSDNSIHPLSPAEGIAPLLAQFLVVPETEEEVLLLAAFIERLLTACPAWKYVNLGDDASTVLLRQTFSDAYSREVL